MPLTKPKIAQNVMQELNRQLNQELSASHTYLGLSIWCELRNLKGFAKYFVRQAGEERAHADKILKHLIDRGAEAELSAIGSPKQDFRSLLDVAQHALAQEQENTRGINSVFEAAVTAKDYPAQVLMQWFISEQVEEEDWASEMVDRVEAATCAGSYASLDRHIERYLDDEVRDVPGETAAT
jgi:ferritin